VHILILPDSNLVLFMQLEAPNRNNKSGGVTPQVAKLGIEVKEQEVE